MATKFSDLVGQFSAVRTAIVKAISAHGPFVDASGPRPILYTADSAGSGFTMTTVNGMDLDVDDTPASPVVTPSETVVAEDDEEDDAAHSAGHPADPREPSAG